MVYSLMEFKCDIPDTLLTKLFDATGNLSGGNKGFYLFFVDNDGNPNCVARPVDGTTRLALTSVIEDYKKALEEDDLELDI